MDNLDKLLQNNRAWAAAINARIRDFSRDSPTSSARNTCGSAARTAGCPPTRSPASLPGEVFVHRNVANVVAETDFNVLAVLQYAVDVLKVRHIIVCGHYGCGGVTAALENFRHGMIDNWLSGIRALRRLHREELDALPPEAAADRLCELNVLAQARHVAHTTIVEDAWERGQKIAIHSWIYRLDTGIITPLAPPISRPIGQFDPHRIARPSDEIADSG